jgi:Flp pilus assembly protein TadD
VNRSSARNIVLGGLVTVVALVGWQSATRHFRRPASARAPVSVTIDYPDEGSVFPPEFPTFSWQWRDADDQAAIWEINIVFSDGSAAIRRESTGEPMRIGESDPRCVSPTNQPPALTPKQATGHTWVPDAATWSAIKQHSVGHPATIVITGRRRGDSRTIASRGQVSIQTSSDPVGAPIFYRDVPLMPSESEKGVIKPLAPQAVPLIAWRLRNIGDTQSRVVMQGLHTCANCHSFSADGSTLGLDLDGPQNDKGLYAIVKVQPQMTIRNEDLVAWSAFKGKLGSKLRVGFMSQVSPDARYVITTVNDSGVDQTSYQRRKDPIDLVRNYYVANFKDYRFLQVFYPTRGVLAWYSREPGHLQYLPGADDAHFVHANAVLSPDGRYLVFARAEAQDAYPALAQPAESANDPKETQIRYDLYRIPFNDGKGGKPEPIVGASHNGMSNSFPKISPDGRWIVFVQSRNGLLMRPDSQLFIVPATGGTARRMKCNTPLMNSWHSFSPNGRWLVFSSKSQSPYTQMFLTHLDESGNDSPAILIENSTAANRAVNIPEFVNVPPDGMVKIDTPAAEYALHVDLAIEAMKHKRYADSALEWYKALGLAPREARAHNGLGVVLVEVGKLDEAIAHYREALALDPQYAEAYNNLGDAFAHQDAVKEATTQFEKAVELEPGYTIARANLGLLLARKGRTDEAIVQLRKVVEQKPDAADAHRDLGHALADKGSLQAASVELAEAVRLSGGRDPLALHVLGRVLADMGNLSEAVQTDRQALELATELHNARLAQAVTEHLNELLQRQRLPVTSSSGQGP